MVFNLIQAGRYRWIEYYNKYFFIQEILSQISVYVISILNYLTCLNCTQFDNVSFLNYQIQHPVIALSLTYIFNLLLIIQEYISAYLSRYKFKHTAIYWASLQLTLYGIKVFPIFEIFLINMLIYQLKWNILQTSLIVLFQAIVTMLNNIFYSSASTVYFSPKQIMMPIQQYKYMGYYSTIFVTNVIFCFRPYIGTYHAIQTVISIMYVIYIPQTVIYYDTWSNLMLVIISTVYQLLLTRLQAVYIIIISIINSIRFLWYTNQLTNNILRKAIFLNFIKSGYIGKIRFHNMFQLCRKIMYESSEKLNIRFKLFYQQYNEMELSIFDDIYTKFNYPHLIEFLLRLSNMILMPIHSLIRVKKQKIQLAYNVCITQDGNVPTILQIVAERHRDQLYMWYTGKMNVIDLKILQVQFNNYLRKIMFMITAMTGHLYYQINQHSLDDKRLLEAILEAVRHDIGDGDFSQITIQQALKTYHQLMFNKSVVKDCEFMYWLWRQKHNVKLLKSQILHEIIDYNTYITKSLWIDYLHTCLTSTAKNIKIEQKHFLKNKLGEQIVHSNINYKILRQLDQTSTMFSLLFPWLQPDVRTNLSQGRKLKFDATTGKNIYIVYSPQKYYDFEKEINIFCIGEPQKKLDLKLQNKVLQQIIDKVNQQQHLDTQANVNITFNSQDEDSEDEEIHQIVQQSNFQKIERYLQAFVSVQSKAPTSTNITLDPDYKIVNTKIENQEYKNVQCIGFNIKNLHLFSLTQLLDLINNVILKNYKIQNSQALINKVYVDHYKGFSYYVLGFWKLWQYYDADNINYQLILFALGLIEQNFRKVDKAFNKTFKKQKEYLLLCAYKQFHQDFQFNKRQYQKLTHQLYIYEKLKQKQERNPFAQKNQYLKQSVKTSFQSSSNVYSNISEIISRINSNSSENFGLDRKKTPVYWQSQFFNSQQKYKKMIAVKHSAFITIVCALFSGCLWVIQIFDMFKNITDINNYVKFHDSSLKLIEYQNQILSNSMSHTAANLLQYKQVIDDIIVQQLQLNFKNSIRTSLHRNYVNINTNLYQTNQLGNINTIVNQYEIFYLLAGSAIQTLQLNYNDSIHGNGDFAGMLVQQLINNSNLFSYMFQNLKSSIITSICVNIAVNNFTQLTLITVFILVIVMFLFYILQYYRIHDTTEILRFVRNTRRHDIELITKYYNNLFYQTKKIQVDKIQCISGYNSRVESKLQSRNVSQHFDRTPISSNTSNSDDILNERIKQLEKLQDRDQKQQARLHNYKKIKDYRLNNRFMQKNKTTLRILISYLLLFIASFFVVVQIFSCDAHYKIQLNNYNKQISKLPQIEILLNQFKSKITSTIEYVQKYPISDRLYQETLRNQILLINNKNSFFEQINMLYTNYVFDQNIPPNIFKQIFAGITGRYRSSLKYSATYVDRDEILNFQQLLKLNNVLDAMLFQLDNQTDIITSSLLQFDNQNKQITFFATKQCDVEEYNMNMMEYDEKVKCAIYSDQFLYLLNSVLKINPFNNVENTQYKFDDWISTLIITIIMTVLDAIFLVFLYFNIKVVIEIYGSMVSKYPYIYILFIILVTIKIIIYIVLFRIILFFKLTVDKQNVNIQNSINLLQTFVNTNDLKVYIDRNILNQSVDYPNILEYDKQKFNYIDIILQFKHLFLDQNQVYYQEIKNYKTQLELLNNPRNKFFNLYNQSQIVKKLFDYQIMQIQLNSVDFFYSIYSNMNETIRILVIFLYPAISYIVFTLLLNEIMYIKYWDRYCNFSTSKQTLSCKDIQMELKQIGQHTQNNPIDIKLSLDTKFLYRTPKLRLIINTLPLFFLAILFCGYNVFSAYINDKVIRTQELEKESTNFLQELLIKYQTYMKRQYIFKQQDPNFINNSTIMESMEHDAYQVKLIHSFIVGNLNKYYLSTLSYQKYGEQQNIYMLPNQLTNQAIISRNYLLDNYQVIQPQVVYYQKYFISSYSQSQIRQQTVKKIVDINNCSIFQSIQPIYKIEISQVVDLLSSLPEFLDSCTQNSSCNELESNLGSFYCGVQQFYEQNINKIPYPCVLMAVLNILALVLLVVLLFISNYFGFYRFAIKRLKIYQYMIDAICNKQMRKKANE